MKSLYRIHSFFKGIRAQSIIISVMIIGSVVLGLLTVAKLNYLLVDYNMLKGASAETYYIGNLSTPSSDRPWSEMGVELLNTLKEFPAVERAYGIKSAGPVMYNGENINILVYPKEMFQDFPSLKRLGYDFEKDTNGFVLHSIVFKDFTGDSADIALYKTEWKTVKIHINAKVNPSTPSIAFGGSRTSKMTADLLLAGSNNIICLDNEVNQRLLEEYAGVVTMKPNVVFKLKSDASKEEKEAVLTYAGTVGNCATLDEIATESLKQIKEEIKTNLPRPLFLFFTSAIAYLSTAVLIVFRKKKELSIHYLCGASINKCISTVMISVTTVVLIPCLICLALFFVLRVLQKTMAEEFWGMLFDWNCLYLILAFFAITLLLTIVSAFLSLRKKTPVELLRGAE